MLKNPANFQSEFPIRRVNNRVMREVMTAIIMISAATTNISTHSTFMGYALTVRWAWSPLSLMNSPYCWANERMIPMTIPMAPPIIVIIAPITENTFLTMALDAPKKRRVYMLSRFSITISDSVDMILKAAMIKIKISMVNALKLYMLK